jgi:cytochrome c553
MLRVRSILVLGVALAACGENNGNEPPIGSDAGTSLPPDAALSSGTPDERGGILFRSLRCANCHGNDGRGSPNFPGAPNVVGRTMDDLRTALIRPCGDPNAIADCHPLKIADLDDQKLADLAAFLASLAGADTSENPGPPCTDTPGAICTVAGNGVSGNQNQPGLGARRQYLFWPQNVAIDPQDRVVITDWNNYIIRRIEKAGCEDGDCPITRIIGTGGLGDSCSTPAAPVAALDATMNHPVGLHYDRMGNIVLWGWHQWKVKYIPVNADGTTGEMYCLFGNERGFAGDGMAAGWNFDGMRGPTKFNLPSSVVEDAQGNFYVSDQGNLRIRRIRADSDDVDTPVSEFLRTHKNNIVETWGGGLVDPITGLARRTRPDLSDLGDGGPVSQATFNVQAGFDAIPQMRLALDLDRSLMYVADSENNRIRVIDISTSSATIDTYAGGGEDVVAEDVPAREAKLFRPADVDVVPDGSGDLLVTDTYNHCVRLVSYATRRIRTLAGRCGADTYGYEGDGGPAKEAKLAEPGGAAITRDRTVYVADTLNHRIRRINRGP